jgi:hypothetical protein
MPRWAAIALLCTSVLLLSSFLAWEVPRISHVNALRTDYTETIFGLRAFLVGDNPYDNAIAIKMDRALGDHSVPPPGGRYEHTFNYLLPPALVFLPLLALNDESNTIAVRAITVALYLVALALLVWRFGAMLPAWGQGGLLLAGLGWWPFLAVILPIVQQAGTVFGLLVLAAFLAERNRWLPAGVLSFVALLKPTESILLVAVLAVWALRSSASHARLFLTGIAAIGIPTTLLAFSRRPSWLPEWWRAVVTLHATHYAHEVDPPDALAGVLHVPPVVIWAAAALLGIVLAINCWQRVAAAVAHSDQGDALYWWLGLAAVFTLLVIPRAGTYDMVIGLIAWFVALRAATLQRTSAGRVAVIALVTLFIATGLLGYRDHAAVEFPVWAIGLAVALWLCRGSTEVPAVGPFALGHTSTHVPHEA